MKVFNGKYLHNKKRRGDTRTFKWFNESKKTTRILHGEAGVGKSRVLDKFYQILKQDNHYSNTHFVGYYDKSKAVIVEASSYLYQFGECLLD